MQRLYIPLILILLFSPLFSYSQDKVIHIYVALCDNENQGIVPVPEKIGNGMDPFNNLYWGAGYGIKNWFRRKDADWEMVECKNPENELILERCIFKHRTMDAWIIADAWAGHAIAPCTEALMKAASGNQQIDIQTSDKTIQAGSSADLLVYIGHNGLMDFDLSSNPRNKDGKEREMVLLACSASSYFETPLKTAGAYPVVWTTGLMAPEAYSLGYLLKPWLKGKTRTEIAEAAAQGYHAYQKCGIRGARNLMKTGW